MSPPAGAADGGGTANGFDLTTRLDSASRRVPEGRVELANVNVSPLAYVKDDAAGLSGLFWVCGAKTSDCNGPLTGLKPERGPRSARLPGGARPRRRGRGGAVCGTLTRSRDVTRTYV